MIRFKFHWTNIFSSTTNVIKTWNFHEVFTEKKIASKWNREICNLWELSRQFRETLRVKDSALLKITRQETPRATLHVNSAKGNKCAVLRRSRAEAEKYLVAERWACDYRLKKFRPSSRQYLTTRSFVNVRTPPPYCATARKWFTTADVFRIRSRYL